MVAPLPPPDPTTRAGQDAAGPAAPPRPRRAGWVVPLAVAGAVVLAGIVGYSLLRAVDDGKDGPGAGDPASWDSFALVDPASGEVTVLDQKGAEVTTIETGLGDVTVRSFGPSQLILVADDEVALVDVAGEETERVAVPGDADVFATATGPPIAFFARPRGGTVHVWAGDDLVDVGAAVGWDDPAVIPFNVLASPDGEHLSVLNQRDELETAIVSTDDGEVTTVPGGAVALTDESVTTQRRDGDATVVEQFDLDGESQGTVELATRPTALFGTGDDDLIGITLEGAILRISASRGTSEELAQLDIDQEIDDVRVGGRTARNAVVIDAEAEDGADLAFVVHDDGSWSGPVAVGSDLRAIEVGPPDGCATFAGDDLVTVLRLADGEVLQQVEGEVVSPLVFSSFDHCTVVPVGEDQRRLVTPERIVTLAEGQSVRTVSPDGAWALVDQRPADGEERRVLAVPVEAIDDDGAFDPEDAVELDAMTTITFAHHG